MWRWSPICPLKPGAGCVRKPQSTHPFGAWEDSVLNCLWFLSTGTSTGTTHPNTNDLQQTHAAPHDVAWSLFLQKRKSADPLPPIPASCRGDRRGMQLEVTTKVDSQDRFWDRSWTSPGSPGTGPGTGPGTLVLLFQMTCSQPKLVPGPIGPRFGPGTGVPERSGTGVRTSPRTSRTGLGPVWEAGPGIKSWRDCGATFPDWHPGRWTGSQVVTDCDQLRGTNSLVSRTSST